MLLAVDLGNTQTLIGVYAGETLAASWRIDTDHSIVPHELESILRRFFEDDAIDPSAVRGVVLATVVPALREVWQETCRSLFSLECLVVEARHLEGLLEVRTQGSGADRLANAVAGADLYGKPVIVVDLGTATDAEVIDGTGAFVGGFIAPGLATSMDALVKRTAQLPEIDLADPGTAIGAGTVEAIQAGVVLGEAARIDGLVGRIRKQLGSDAPVVVTGGLSGIIGPLCETQTIINPYLTLWGLKLIFEHVAQ